MLINYPYLNAGLFDYFFFNICFDFQPLYLKKSLGFQPTKTSIVAFTSGEFDSLFFPKVISRYSVLLKFLSFHLHSGHDYCWKYDASRFFFKAILLQLLSGL